MSNNHNLSNYQLRWMHEVKKCEDPVYFYENYARVVRADGGVAYPPPLSDNEKYQMRVMTFARKIKEQSGYGNLFRHDVWDGKLEYWHADDMEMLDAKKVDLPEWC